MSPFQQLGDREPEPRRVPERRRHTPEQGRALETLGHAIEYLVDSRLFDQWESPSDAEAVHLLMSCSRSVYAGCEELAPWHQRVQRSLMRRLHLQDSHFS